jgi:murein DD-endopeptidase MepM/ murein hydrolase activator NlpD
VAPTVSHRLRLILTAAALLVSAGLPAAATAAPAPVFDARPFVWPTVGWITQQFGCTGFAMEPRHGHCAHFHYGVDIANERGTPVYAAAAGVITIAGWDPWIRHNPDWMVVIKDADGFKTMYAHLRAERLPGIHRSAHVEQGQLIGFMDSTGHSTGPHLLRGVFLRDRPVDPERFVLGLLQRG